jgi:cytochrome c peroxidase
MKLRLVCVVICTLLITASALIPPQKNDHISSPKKLDWLRHESIDFIVSAEDLESAIDHIDNGQPATIEKAKQLLKECRLRYKHIAFFLEYFFPDRAKLFNAAPKPEVEEPGMQYNDPVGLQVIESLLFNDHSADKQKRLSMKAHLMLNAATGIPDLFTNVNVNDSQLLESLRIELIRIMTLYISGYDAPIIKTGIAEAAESINALDEGLAPYLGGYTQKDSIRYYLTACKTYLKTNSDFDSFDRLFFLTRFALPLQKQINELILAKNLVLNTSPALNINARNLFSANAINKKAFPNAEDEMDVSLVNLGKKLFFENALSGNHSRNCSSCHSPEGYFTDGMSRNKTLDGKDFLPRNTPTLLYACYQYSQFWDGRAAGLKAQIATVLNNKNEMNGSDDTIISRLQKDSFYVATFKKIWMPKDRSTGITMRNIASAIAAYMETLTPFQSPFDQYMQGNEQALSVPQKRGFNLFMGKAECGTCHFAPLFNGLTPPLYDGTEYEVLGTPIDDSLEKPRPDADKGRYNMFSIHFYDGAFKTPTVRDAAVTAPYMHNGGFRTLEKVISFYDKGGGAGLGLVVPEQTLLSTELHLSKQEQEDLVSFIKALTDTQLQSP